MPEPRRSKNVTMMYLASALFFLASAANAFGALRHHGVVQPGSEWTSTLMWFCIGVLWLAIARSTQTKERALQQPPTPEQLWQKPYRDK